MFKEFGHRVLHTVVTLIYVFVNGVNGTRAAYCWGDGKWDNGVLRLH